MATRQLYSMAAVMGSSNNYRWSTTMRTRTSIAAFLFFVLVVETLLLSQDVNVNVVSAFQPSLSTGSFPRIAATTSFHRRGVRTTSSSSSSSSSSLNMAQVSEQEAKKAIDTVVKALRKDSEAKKELGKLGKVENVLGYGSPQKGKVAVRFNASFQKSGGSGSGGGFLGMGGGNKASKDDDGKNRRGTMVGQVKASLDQTTGKIVDCSVFRDLGYGRTFNLRT